MDASDAEIRAAVLAPSLPPRRLGRWLSLLAILLFASAVRLVLSQTTRVVWGDEPFYLWLGRNLVTGQGFGFMGSADVHHGPLFPALAGALYLGIGDLELASELLYVLFGALLILPMYGIGRQLGDERLGLAAAILTAVVPAFTAATLHWGTMTEPIYLFWLYLGLWAALHTTSSAWCSLEGALPEGVCEAAAPRHRDRWWAYLLSGLAIGLAYLTRPEAIGYAVLTVAFLLILRLWRAGRKEATFWNLLFWLKMALFVLGFACCFVPYAYYVRQHTGAWMVSEKVGVAYLTGIGLAHGDTAAFDKATWGLDSTGLETFFFSSESYNVSMLDLILADPKTFLGVLYLNIQRFVQVLIDWTLLPYVALPLVVLGLFDKGWSRERTVKEVFLILSMAPVLVFILFFIQARYIVAVLPVFVLWAARGLLRFSDWLIGTIIELRTPDPAPDVDGSHRPYWHMPARWRRVLTAAPVVVAVMACLVAYPSVLRQVTSVGSVRLEHRIIGELLADRVIPDTVIMSRYPAIAFHAGARWVPTPNASFEEILRYAGGKNVALWAIDQRELAYRPQFSDLITGEQVPRGLELVLSSDSGGERLVVYVVVYRERLATGG